MSMIKIHRFILTMITIATIGLTIDSVFEAWEFWINPLLVLGIISLWVLHIGQYLTERSRETLYLAFGMFAALFHGVHETSFYDVCSVITLMMALFSLMDRLYVLKLILAEYFFIMAIQFMFVIKPGSLTFDTITVARLILQCVIVISIYYICRMTVTNRLEKETALKNRDDDIKAYDNDMEDFLSNISHELRTPVNVVNGMSRLLLKQDTGKELCAIRDAGLRLSNQIEDIQDYTEVKRSSLVLEEENYMVTSLINDVVADFKRYEAADDLELVIDMDPAVPTVMKGDVRKIKKILRHLLVNSIKFTRQGGIYIKIFTMDQGYGANLCIEVTDTGIGMERRDLSMIGAGMYQTNKKRNRSTGGIGLGLPVVYGLAHKMGGFIKIESDKGIGTTVRMTVPQSVVDRTPCLMADSSLKGDVIFHVKSAKYKVPAVREFYRQMATNLAVGIHRTLYSAESINEIKSLIDRLDVSHIFMGEEEYDEAKAFFDELSCGDIVVAVSARPGFKPEAGSRVIVMPKPLYGFPVVRLLNGERLSEDEAYADIEGRPVFENVKALIVDDEPMNLVVASGMFKDEYKMITDTAMSGREAIDKFVKENYDIVFMDHMMPEMDGVEAMKRIKDEAKKSGRSIVVVALTANAVSGAREMFLSEGFDGFVAKPIDISEFERVMKRVLPDKMVLMKGGT
ncbi:MAG: response regulator [Lachnospiraceae bacterium]|nr:response regulator [Lachnospiraceae bacterium]